MKAPALELAFNEKLLKITMLEPEGQVDADVSRLKILPEAILTFDDRTSARGRFPIR